MQALAFQAVYLALPTKAGFYLCQAVSHSAVSQVVLNEPHWREKKNCMVKGLYYGSTVHQVITKIQNQKATKMNEI